MTGPRSLPSRLVGHDKALGTLLASLLAEVSSAAGEPLPEAPARADADPPTGTQPADRLNTAEPQPLTGQHGQTAPKPVWAAHDFRALLFRIGEYRFAMPLVLMRSVASLPEQRTRLPSQPPWHLGLVHYRGRSMVVMDLGQWIGVRARCAAPRYLLVIGDGTRAVVCDQIEDAVLVCPRRVRWRRVSGDRAWLAGFLVQQMCVLLDADALDESIGHG